MAESIKSILKQAGELFQNVKKKKFILPAAVAITVIAVGIIGAVFLNRVRYTVLYSQLSAEEAGIVMNLLEEMGVDAKAEGTDKILVPEDQADELRIELAAQGYPETGLNYDIFSNSSDIGSTDLERQTYLQYQLQENMRSSICRMDKIEDCIVIVNLATTSSFVLSNSVTDASVAVLLSLENGEELSDDEARTIGEFVLKCVPKLKMENVSIADSGLNYYSILSEESGQNASEYTNAQQQMTEQMKEILTQQVLRVLQPAFGEGNVAVAVNLYLDFNRETVSSVEFSPPVEGETEGMLISSDEQYDDMKADSSGTAAGQAGTDSNGVSASEYMSDDQGGTASTSYSKTFNYELNQIQTQIEKAQGMVQDLSVAVLINSEVEGTSEYADKVKNLVAGAIGADSKYISVELMPFIKSADGTGFDSYFAQSREVLSDLSRINLIRTVVISATLILAVFMILNFFIRKKAAGGFLSDVDTNERRATAEMQSRSADDDESMKEEEERLLQELMTKKSDKAEKVEELMNKYPDAAVQILRTWLLEDK